MKKDSVFITFLLGTAVGTGIGMLCAPDTGKNTREKLCARLTKYRGELKALISDLIEGISKESTGITPESKRIVNDVTQKAESLLKNLEDLLHKIKTKDDE